MSLEHSYEDLVEQAAKRVEEIFKKGRGVVVLAGPGSSRLEVARRVPESRVVSYKLPGLEELQGEGRAELLRFEGAEPLVGGKTLAEYIEKLSPARVIVVPESTIEAIRAYRSLSERLEEDKVALVFTPGVHEEELKRSGFKPPGEAEVDCSAAFKAFNAKPEGGGKGVSLKLLQYHRTGEWERLRRGAEALRALSPGRLGLRGALVNAGRRALSSLGERLAEELYAVAGGAAVASALVALASPLGLPAVVAQAVGYSFPPKLLLEIARELIGAGGGRPEREHVKRLAELIQAAIIASEFVGDERLEGVADEVASRWGLSLEEFHKLVENLRKLATQEVATEDDLKKLREEVKDDLEALEQRLRELFEQRIEILEEKLEDRLGQLEGRIKKLEKRVGRIEDQLRPLRALTRVYQEPGDLGFDLERGKFWVGKEYTLVTSGRFVEHAGKLLEALELGELVVVTGPRGVGKSVLARYALAKLLQSGHWRVYRAKTLDEESAAEVADSLARVADNSPWRLAVLYDPSAPLFYEPKRKASPRPDVGPTVGELAGLHRAQGGRVPVVVVLPEDLYEHVKDELEGAYVLRVDLRQEDFLADIVRAYSRGACGENVYESIAGEITVKYEGGYTLVARYAGEWLREAGGCDWEAVREALGTGAGSAMAFIALFIYKAVFRGNLDLFQKMAVPFIARAELDPLPPKWLERFPVLEERGDGGYVVNCLENPLEHLTEKEKEFIREWLSQPKEDIVEDVIWRIARGKLSGRLQELAEKGLVGKGVLETARGMEGGVKLVREALGSASFDGECREKDPIGVLFKALASDPKLRKLAEENSYHFVALVGLAHTLLPVKPLLEEAGFPEGLKGWFTVRGEMPPSARRFLVEAAPAFRLAVDPCEVLKSVHQQAEEEKGYRLTSLLAALGALAISEGEPEGCLDEAVLATGFALRIIPLSLLVIPYLARIPKAPQGLVGKLMREGLWLEAVSVAYSASRWEAWLASDLLQTVERGAGSLERLDPLTRTLYEEADYLARSAQDEWLGKWAGRVEAFLNGLKEDVVGLHARALLGARLANALRTIDPGMALKWAEEARRALEQLERLDGKELADSLEPLLKVRAPFVEREEAAKLWLADLKLTVLYVRALIELMVDAEEALRLAEELHVITEKLGPSELALSRSLRARAMLLAGLKREDVIGEIRESWELAQGEGFINISEDIVEGTTAEYAASFLLEGMTREALEQYREYGFRIRDPEFRAALLALLLAFGAEEVREDVKEVREEFEEYRRRALAYSAPDPLAAALFVLYEEIWEEEAWYSLEPQEHEVFADILEVAWKGDVNLLLQRLKKLPRLGEQVRELEPHLEGLSALDVLEAIAALTNSRATFVEVVRHACLEGRAGLAKALAEYWQEEMRVRGFALTARLWADLAKSLEGGCGEGFREALVRLFYLLV